MGDNQFDFMRAFHGVNSIAIEGVSRTIGMVVAGLRTGMVTGGMHPHEADRLIAGAWGTFVREMAAFAAAQSENS